MQGERTQSQPMLLQYNSMYNGPLSSVKSNYMKIIWTFCIHLGVFFLHRQYFFCTSKLFINSKTTLLVFLNFKSINFYFSLLFNASLVSLNPSSRTPPISHLPTLTTLTCFTLWPTPSNFFCLLFLFPSPFLSSPTGKAKTIPLYILIL